MDRFGRSMLKSRFFSKNLVLCLKEGGVGCHRYWNHRVVIYFQLTLIILTKFLWSVLEVSIIFISREMFVMLNFLKLL